MATSVKYSGWKRTSGQTYISAFNLGIEGLRITKSATGCHLRLLGDTPGTNYVLFDASVPRLAIVGSIAVTIASTLDVAGLLTANGGITIGDTWNISVSGATGTKIGTATNQKIGFWNAAPVAQQAHIADPTGGATTDTEARTAIASINALCATLGLTAAS